MKAISSDYSWLPPSEEWDFRSITVSECRIACHWEYSRQISQVISHHAPIDAKGTGKNSVSRNQIAQPYFPAIYRQAAREFFPQAWMSLTKEQRTKVTGSFYAMPALQVRKLGDYLERMKWSTSATPKTMQPYLEYSYVIQPNFSVRGVEAVMKEFEAWARKEAKQYHPSPRAKGAEPPFDALKWLAVLRVEEARSKARVRFENAQESLAAYRKKNPQPDSNGVFPVYASQGAWSKARADAQRLQSKTMNGSSELLAGLS
jgi:hypothetical protein